MKLDPFTDLFWLSSMHVGMIRGFNEEGGGNISVDLSLFVLLYNTSFMKKLKFNDFLKTKKKM